MRIKSSLKNLWMQFWNYGGCSSMWIFVPVILVIADRSQVLAPPEVYLCLTPCIAFFLILRVIFFPESRSR